MTNVANCTRCQRIFQRTHSPMCPECHQDYMSKLSHVYRYVQEHPQMTLEDIAEQCELPYRDVEELFFQGKLGLATSKVIYHCQRCSLPMAATMRKGRFCTQCAEQFEAEAKLDQDKEPVKESAVDKLRPKVKLKSDESIVAVGESKSEEPARSTRESYGFKRVNSDRSD